MKKTRFTEEQMVTILREADMRPVPEVAKNEREKAAGDLFGLATHDYIEAGWRIHFRAIPKSPAARGKPGVKPLRIIGPGDVQWIDSHTPSECRTLNGAWTSKGRPRYTRNSAALMAHGLSPWTLGAELRLYHNPWALRPYTSCLIQLPQAIPVDGEMTWTDGPTAATLLRLPNSWPFSQPVQGHD